MRIAASSGQQMLPCAPTCGVSATFATSRTTLARHMSWTVPVLWLLLITTYENGGGCPAVLPLLVLPLLLGALALCPAALPLLLGALAPRSSCGAGGCSEHGAGLANASLCVTFKSRGGRPLTAVPCCCRHVGGLWSGGSRLTGGT